MDDDEDDCGEMISRGSCKYDAKKYIDGVDECGFEVVMDSCTGDEISCEARIVVNGEEFTGDCEELQEHFGLPDDDDDDDEHDCESYVCEESYSCKNDYRDKLDHCMVYNCFNECNQHEECMVEYMD